MSKSRSQRASKVKRSRHSPDTHAEAAALSDLADPGRQRRWDIAVSVCLVGLAVFQCVSLYGHTEVPNSDFSSFLGTGRALWSFRLPESLKRGPMVGVLLYPLSRVVGGEVPALRAGWLLNCVMYCASALLLWRAGRRVVGRSAAWLAVLALMNPQILYHMTDPIAETTLMCFTLATLWLIFRRSRWAYLAAGLTAVVRYEGAALILAAVVVDMIEQTNWRRRLSRLGLAAAAGAPLGLWMLATALTWKSQTDQHYLSVIASGRGEFGKGQKAVGLWVNLRTLWEVAFLPLSIPRPGLSQSSAQTWMTVSKVLAVAGFGFGAVWGLVRRNWNLLAVLLFVVPYFAIHAVYPYPIPRFYASIAFLVLWVWWYGVASAGDLAGKLIQRNEALRRAWPVIRTGAWCLVGLAVLLAAGGWLEHLDEIALMSRAARWLPVAAAVALVGLLAAGLYLSRGRGMVMQLAVLLAVGSAVVCSSFLDAQTLGSGRKEYEFKQLAIWIMKNVPPGEKLAVYNSPPVRLFLEDNAKDVLSLEFRGMNTPADLVEALRKQDVQYVAWSTRDGANPRGHYQDDLHLGATLGVLADPRRTDLYGKWYRFVAQVPPEDQRNAGQGFLYVYRLLPGPGGD